MSSLSSNGKRAGALAAWTAEHAGALGYAAQARDAELPGARAAVAIVRRFVAERGLVLYGGQAIDYALRLRGAGIYPPDQLPDLDFYSSRNVEDAYELAEELGRAGFPAVEALPAIHLQTMRVRTDFVFVADISYAPPEVLAAIPTLTYGGMKIVHPDYQRLDMHLAFCFPYANPPREDVFHRFGKDLRRFNLLAEKYPFNAPETSADNDTQTVSAEIDLGRVALHGFVAYGILRSLVGEKSSAPRLEVRIAPGAGGRHRVALDAPAGAPPRLEVAAPDPETVIVGNAEVTHYAAYMDARAEETAAGGLSVFSTAGKLLAVSEIPVGETRVCVVSPQYLLLYFLFGAVVGTPRTGDRALCARYYCATLDLLRDAEGAEGDKDLPGAFGLPVADVLGERNESPAYLTRLRQSEAQVAACMGRERPAPPSTPPRPAIYRYAAGREPPAPPAYAEDPEFRRAGQSL